MFFAIKSPLNCAYHLVEKYIGNNYMLSTCARGLGCTLGYIKVACYYMLQVTYCEISFARFLPN